MVSANEQRLVRLAVEWCERRSERLVLLSAFHARPCRSCGGFVFLSNPQNTGKPLKDFKQTSDMIRCTISKLSEDGSGWGEKSRSEEGKSGYVETSWEAILVSREKMMVAQIRVLVIRCPLHRSRSGWIPNILRRQDLNLEMRGGQNWLDGGAMD